MKIIRNVLAVVIGVIVGSVVNMGLITISGSIIPPPNGADVTTMEGLVASMHLFEPKHFIMPFLAHALGTLVGAFFAAIVASSGKKWFALSIGFFFLIGGVVNVILLPSPLWFTILDLTLAYVPMAFLGYKLTFFFNKNNE